MIGYRDYVTIRASWRDQRLLCRFGLLDLLQISAVDFFLNSVHVGTEARKNGFDSSSITSAR